MVEWVIVLEGGFEYPDTFASREEAGVVCEKLGKAGVHVQAIERLEVE